MLRAAFARHDITVYEPGMAMLGWEQPRHKVRGVAHPLHTRALVIDKDGERAALVVSELGYITLALRQTVLAALAEEPELGLGPQNVALCATHTHSGPSGISQFPMYNTTNRGFSPMVFDAVVDEILCAIRGAVERLEPARLRYAETTIPLDEPVAFNRAMAPHLSNPEKRGGTKTRRRRSTA